MRTSIAVAGTLCIAVVAVAILASGPVPSLDGGADGSAGETPGATTQPSADQRGSATSTTGVTTATSTPTISAFAFSVDQVESCGESCRRVSGTVTNQGSAAASNVSVDLRLYAGNGTTGNPVWNGTEVVGTLAANESVSVTRKVDLSTADAFSVGQAGGWVTIEAVVRSDRGSTTITKRRNAN